MLQDYASGFLELAFTGLSVSLGTFLPDSVQQLQIDGLKLIMLEIFTLGKLVNSMNSYLSHSWLVNIFWTTTSQNTFETLYKHPCTILTMMFCLFNLLELSFHLTLQISLSCLYISKSSHD